ARAHGHRDAGHPGLELVRGGVPGRGRPRRARAARGVGRPHVAVRAPAGEPPGVNAFWRLGFVVAAVTALGIPAHAPSGARVTADEPQYLLTAISLGEDGDLDIFDELESERYRRFHRVDLPRQTWPLD